MNIFFQFLPLLVLADNIQTNSKCEDLITLESQLRISSGSILQYDESFVTQEFSRYLGKSLDKISIFFGSAIWLSDQNLYLVVCRLNIIGTSVLYVSYFNEHWDQITYPRKPKDYIKVKIPAILPIPVPDHDIDLSGPEDPKIFQIGNEIVVTFNMLDTDGNRKYRSFSLKTRNLNTFTLQQYLKINNGRSHLPLAEKNWAPIIVNSNIYFLNNFYGFQVINCNEQSVCYHVSGHYDWRLGQLKPGSPFMRFEDTDYYYSFSFKHLYCRHHKDSKRFYRPVLTVINAKNEQFSLVFHSKPTFFFDVLAYEPFGSKKELENFENADLCEKEQIIIITSIARVDLQSDDTTLIGYLNDKSPFLVKIQGLQKLIRKIIDETEEKYY